MRNANESTGALATGYTLETLVFFSLCALHHTCADTRLQREVNAGIGTRKKKKKKTKRNENTINARSAGMIEFSKRLDLLIIATVSSAERLRARGRIRGDALWTVHDRVFVGICQKTLVYWLRKWVLWYLSYYYLIFFLFPKQIWKYDKRVSSRGAR